ncbi:MAG: RHS repeat-associated core domain-containing protein [Phycisphaerales bacterium]
MMDDWRLRTESVCVREIRGAGTHTIRWRYSKNGSGSAGEDCVWVDYVRWSGTMPDAGAWGQIEYVYDASGRRIEKKVDGDTELKFLYDGDLIIAEYDANDTLLRKYVHGPCIDEPICMIESSGTYAGTQYYHYDALGSVVALTDPNGDVVQLYEYSVYGQVAASDANHPNRFMFTGREFDKDTGLYYYRARYYHPEIGRFLQTDPIGYGDGMNWYTYCRNSPIISADPMGLFTLILESGSPDDLLAVDASLQRIRTRCRRVIEEIDMSICCMGCNQDHSPQDCPVIADLQWLKEKLQEIIAGIESGTPLAIRMKKGKDAYWAGAFVDAGEDMSGDPDLADEPAVTYPTLFYNETAGFDGDTTLNEEWMWDMVTLHELSHYVGVPDPVLGLPIRNFYDPYAIEQLAVSNLWGTTAWMVLRYNYECVEKKHCTCSRGHRDLWCPKHGRG